MAEDTNTQEAAAAAQQEGPQFALEKIYLKDLSFETPQGVEGLTQKWTPKVNQDVSTKISKINDERYEVVLTVTAEIKDEDKTIYLIEVQQAGLFMVKGVEEKQLPQLMNTQCPTLLFPYAREVVDSIALKGGFPALNLPPINFEALFFHAVQQAKAKADAAKEESAATH